MSQSNAFRRELLSKDLSQKIADYLIQNYGLNCLELIKKYDSKKHISIQDLEIIYTIENEGVCKPIDYFMRRSGKIYFRPEEVSTDIQNYSKIFENHLKLEPLEINKLMNEVLDEKKHLISFNNED